MERSERKTNAMKEYAMITLDIGSTLTTDEEGRFRFDKLGMMKRKGSAR